MRSIKPGRGPSISGAIGCVIVAVFGVCWTGFSASMGAPGFSVAFGVVFILAALGGAAYNFYNATARNRFSHFDITGPGEESDPLDPRTRDPRVDGAVADFSTGEAPKFCPFCGTALKRGYEFCPQCGKDI